MELQIVSVLLALSFGLNAVQFIQYRKKIKAYAKWSDEYRESLNAAHFKRMGVLDADFASREKEMEANFAKRPQSVELQEFLADLMAGKVGVFKIERLNQDDLMLRSPRYRT